MKILISKIISKIKKEEYKIDDAITTFDIISIIYNRGKQVIRGIFYKFRIKSNGIIFIGEKVKILSGNKIRAGKGLILEDGCFINALSKGGILIGNNVSVGRNSIIECTGVISELGENLIIEDNVGISANAFISVRGSLKIGGNTIMGPGVSIHAENHNFANLDIPIRKQGVTRQGIEIGEDCWIGAKAVILDGVKIGKGVIIAAGALVNKDINDYEIVAGVPAKVIKSRKV